MIIPAQFVCMKCLFIWTEPMKQGKCPKCGNIYIGLLNSGEWFKSRNEWYEQHMKGNHGSN